MQMEKRKDSSSVDIKNILLDMRKYRMGLIQTPDQLRFSYMAVLEGAKFIKGDASVQVAAQNHCEHFCRLLSQQELFMNTFSVLLFLRYFLYHCLSRG